MKIQRTLFAAIFFLLITGLPGQAKDTKKSPEEISKQHIMDLSNGSLTVVLTSDLKKLNELHSLSQSEHLSEAQRKRISRQYQEVLSARNEFNDSLIQAVKNIFTFCPVQFIYDFQLRNEKPELNHAKADPLLYQDLPGKEYRLRIGRTNEAEQFGIEALILTDDQGNDLTDPFPYYVRLNERAWLGGLLSIFSPKAYGRREASELIAELQYLLSQYYNQTVPEAKDIE